MEGCAAVWEVVAAVNILSERPAVSTPPSVQVHGFFARGIVDGPGEGARMGAEG